MLHCTHGQVDELRPTPKSRRKQQRTAAVAAAPAPPAAGGGIPTSPQVSPPYQDVQLVAQPGYHDLLRSWGWAEEEAGDQAPQGGAPILQARVVLDTQQVCNVAWRMP